ncbi:MAG: hypothetical protein L6R35_004294 [Caloplaca aegaea]|nr:MAG: hypothetical protein L6R35_004294 [Caloplaca aegaea]
MITDSKYPFQDIAERRWNIRLKSEWEAEENYNFALYHTPDCRHKGDDDKCTCGGDNAKQKEFKNAVRVRKKEIRERNGKVAAAESKDQTEDQNKPDTPEKKEESGDEEFMAETPTKSRLKKGGGTPKGRGKTVTWAD